MAVKSKKFVVTGGAGFIGSNLVNELVKNGYEVHVIDNFSTGKKENCNENAKYHELDLSLNSNLKSIKKVFEGSESIFHLAAKARVQPSILNPFEYEKNNTLSTVNIFKAAVDVNVSRVIYSSSSSVYGNTNKLPSSESDSVSPISPYALQKYYGELCCKMFSKVYGIESVSLRYFNVYGEGQNLGGAYATVVGIFLNQKMEGKPLTINGDGTQRRDFTYVGDVVKANILAAESNKVKDGQVINIGFGKNISINELADLIYDKKVYLEPVDEPFENLADISRAQNLLNWKPRMSIQGWIKSLNIKRNS